MSRALAEPDVFRHESLHLRLRAATGDIHQRLHLHSGFLAVRDGTIAFGAYRTLLARLYGFHLPFEQAVKIFAERSRWLRDDLAAMEISGETLETIPLCQSMPRYEPPEARLGALYVVEGSGLGGRVLARNLDHVLGVGIESGRRFFIGRDQCTKHDWQHFLTRLAAMENDPGACERIVAAAITTFSLFEDWMSVWQRTTYG